MRKPDRILLLKMDHIGDALWSFPAITALRSTFPETGIDMLCTPYLAEAFRRVADLTHVIEYNASAVLNERSNILRSLRSRNYDAAIVLGPVDKVNHLAFLSGARERLGYSYAGNPIHTITRRLFLTQSFPHPSDLAVKLGLPLPHEVPSMLKLVEKYGRPAIAEPKLFFPVMAAERESTTACLHNLMPEKRTFAALHLCAKSFPHGWNVSAFTRLAMQLQNTFADVGWIVTAGPAEEPYLDSYRTELLNAGIPVVTGLTLSRMAALLANMRLLVSWDTGIVHLASAVGTPIVDVFPSKDFDYCIQRWGPWGKNAISLAQKNEHLDSIQIENIVSSVIHLLDRSVSVN